MWSTASTRSEAGSPRAGAGGRDGGAPERPRVRRRFGQHFLHDAAVIERIVAAVDPRPGQAMVEIGPGRGALTPGLLRRCGALTAVEIDRDLCEHLRRDFSGAEALRLINGDALAFDFGTLAGTRRLRVVGNLPYNISTPLLFHLLGQSRHIDDVHCTLQREVAERIAAAPGSKHYGRLSVMAQLDCAVERLFPIGAAAFRPRPRVDSTFLRLEVHRDRPVTVADRATFAGLVRHLFSRRRKTLRSSLRGYLDATHILRAGCDPTARPETLAVADFARLADEAGLSGSRPFAAERVPGRPS